MDLQSIIIQLVAGAVGGGTIAALVKSVGMGNIANLVVGAIGGVGGGQILAMLGGAGLSGILGDSSVASAIVSGLAGGGVLTGVAGLLKNMSGSKG